MKTDSGMMHGKWKHKGQRERKGREGNQGRGKRENRSVEVVVVLVGALLL